MRSSIAIALSFLALLLVACAPMEVHEIAGDKEAFDGQTITVSGIAEDTVKIGELSGYSLRDPITDERIAVSSDTLPREGETVRVSGVWVRDSLFGYYLKVED